MNTKMLIKILVTAALAAGAVAGGSFVADDPISITAVINAAVIAAIAYVKQSPVEKKSK